MNSPSFATSVLLLLHVSSPFVCFSLSFYHLGILLPGAFSFVFLYSYQHPSKARVLDMVPGLPSLVRTRL